MILVRSFLKEGYKMDIQHLYPAAHGVLKFSYQLYVKGFKIMLFILLKIKTLYTNE